MSSVFNLPFHSPLLQLYKTVLPHDDEKACIFKSTLLPFCRVDAEERINWGRSMILATVQESIDSRLNIFLACARSSCHLGFPGFRCFRCMFKMVIYRWWGRQERKIKWGRGEILSVLNEILRFFKDVKEKRRRRKIQLFWWKEKNVINKVLYLYVFGKFHDY